jgi:hypothetical protein
MITVYPAPAVTAVVANQGKPYELQVAQGLIPGTKFWFATGYNPDIDTAEETIWVNGGIYVYRTSASILQIVSTSASDAAAGTGARTVFINGLDGSYNEVSETVTLNGTTNVPTVNTYLRVFKMVVVTAGSNQSAVGVLTIQVGATVYGRVAIGDNTTQLAIWTVPAGYTAYLLSSHVATGTAGVNQFVDARLIQRPFGSVFRTISRLTLAQGTADFDGSVVPLSFPEKTDFEVRAVSDNNNNVVSANFAVIYIAN